MSISPREAITLLLGHMSKAIIGQEQVVERLVIGLLANGNLLVEGLPGVAKTRAIKALARSLEADFGRIQFTPDLLPSDITGTEVYHTTGEGGEFRFEPGPIFANIVLGDEINRAPAKVQAALLEAMEERQITVAGTTHPMPALFMVMATQNPVEQEGTYPLPEAQLDRFLMHVNIGYLAVEDEVGVIQLVRGEEQQAAGLADNEPDGDGAPPRSASAVQRIPQAAIFEARREIAALHSAPAMDRYIADLVYATRTPEKYSEQLANWIEIGASPRASLALDRCARVHAWLHDHDYVTPDDVRAVLPDVLRHRLSLTYEAQAEAIGPDQVIAQIEAQVAAP